MPTANDTSLHPEIEQEAIDKALEVVRRAREMKLSIDGVSKNTARDYLAKSAIVHRKLRNGDQIELVFTKYARVSGSFYAMRAALVWSLKRGARICLVRQKRLRRTEGNSAAWMEQVTLLDKTLQLLCRVEELQAEHLLGLASEARKSKHSKRKDLPELPNDWKQRFLERSELSPKYCFPTWIIAATGCRPAELVKEVELRMVGDCVAVKCRGAKLTATSGQEWRTFNLLPGVLPRKLVEKIESHGSFTVSIASTDAFRTHLTRLSKELFPGKAAVTGYSFRHSLAGDLREAGWKAEEIGAVLGQCVAETQAGYGLRKRASSGVPINVGIDKASVNTARPVRALDRSRVEAVIDKAAEKQQSLKNSMRG